VIYKIIDLGGVLPFYKEVVHNYSKVYSPIEFLISIKVKGYNCNIATKEFDIWAITLVFAFLEGYYKIYHDHFYAPILKLLEETKCKPKYVYIMNKKNFHQRRNYLRMSWQNWYIYKGCPIKSDIIRQVNYFQQLIKIFFEKDNKGKTRFWFI